MTSIDSTVKWCKEFLQQINKLPIEYLEGYIDKKKTAAPKVKTEKKPTEPSTKTKPSTGNFKVSVKKLGGVSKAHDVNLGASDVLGSLRKEVAKIYDAPIDGFSLIYKGRPLADDEAPLSSIISDPATPVYVNIKAKPVKNKSPLPDAFWTEFKGLLGKHIAAESADKLALQFKQEHTKWL